MLCQAFADIKFKPLFADLSFEMSNLSPTAVEMAKIGVRRRSSQKTNVTNEIPGAEIAAAESTSWILNILIGANSSLRSS